MLTFLCSFILIFNATLAQIVDDCFVNGRFLELSRAYTYTSDSFVSRVSPRCTVAGTLNRFEVKLSQPFTGIVSLVSSSGPSSSCTAAHSAYTEDSQLSRQVTNARLLYFYLGTAAFKYTVCFNGVASSAYIVALEANDASCYMLGQSASSYTQSGHVSCVHSAQEYVAFDGFSVVSYRGSKQCVTDCAACRAAGGSDCLCNGLFNTNTCATCSSDKCMYDSIGFGSALETNS